MGPDIIYVLGSANLNPRSLGVNRNNNPPRINEAEGSECAVFLQPQSAVFWCDLWEDHLGTPVSLVTTSDLAAEA